MVARVEERSVRLLMLDERKTPHSIEISFTSRATAGALTERFLAYTSINAGRTGYVLVDPRSRAAFPPEAPLERCQLVHGQLLMVVPAQHAPVQRMPILGEDDAFRLVTEIGPQIGLAWTLAAAGRPLELSVDDETGALVDEDSALTDFTVELAADGQGVIVTGRPGVLLIDGADRRGEPVSLHAGSSLAVLDPADPGQTVTVLRIVRAQDHDADRRVEPVVPYRVTPLDTVFEKRPPLTLRLREMPIAQVAPVALVGTLLQQASAFLMPLMLMLISGFNPAYLLFMVLPLGYLGYLYYQKGKEREQVKRDVAQWYKSTAAELGVLQQFAADEVVLLRAAHPPTALLISLALHGQPGLWRGDGSDFTFLKVVVGQSKYVSPATAEIPGDLTDGALVPWRKFIETVRAVPEAPYVVDLSVEGVAIVGSGQRAGEVAAELLLRLALTHSPNALSFAALLPEHGQDLETLAWTKWLPHFHTPNDLFPVERFVHGAARGDKALSAAIEAAERASGRLLLLVHEGSGIEIRLLEQLLEAGGGAVVALWFGSVPTRVPDLLRRRIFPAPALDAGAVIARIEPDGASVRMVPHDEVELMWHARALAGLVDETGTTASTSIPNAVTLSAVLPFDPARPARSIHDAWRANTAERNLVAVIGTLATGVFEFDLVEHGPHALVGGTTGSGKSEFLRTLILSLAGRYSPGELSLLLIDFKGGAALRDFEQLPHQVGLVSNLEAADVHRTVEFLRVEVQRRQRILRTYQGEYSRYRDALAQDDGSAGGPEPLLPRLVVIIDEFSGFVVSGKGYLDEIVNVAARGRSLGMHLVLATQRPGSGIPREVTANIDARFCLRTLDEQDSITVIDTPDAARIPKALPGRAFARLSAGGLIEFQTAWTEARSFAARSTAPNLRLAAFEPVVPVESAPQRGIEDEVTAVKDFTLIVNSMIHCAAVLEQGTNNQYLDADGVRWSAAAWQPVLASALPKDISAQRPAGDFATSAPVPIGLRDEPQHQRQTVEKADLAIGGLLMTGGTLSGRTELLRGIAAAFATAPGHRLIVLDGADGSLAESLRHVAASTIHHPSRGELEFLYEQLTLPDYRAGTERVLVLADRIDVLAATFGDFERLASLIVNGPVSRVHFAATTDNRAQLEPVLLRAFHWHYLAQDQIPGRVSTPDDLLVQLYRAETPPRRADVGERPLGLPPRDFAVQPSEPPAGHVHLGVDELRHVVVDAPIRRGLSIVGPEGSGKTTALLSIGERLAARLGRKLPLLAAYRPEAPWFADFADAADGLPETGWLDGLADQWWSPQEPNYLLIDDADSMVQFFAAPGGLARFTPTDYDVLNRLHVRILATGSFALLNGIGFNLPGVRLFNDQLFLALQPPAGARLDRAGLALHWDTVVRPRPWRQYEPGEGVLVTPRGRHDIRVHATTDAAKAALQSHREGGEW